VPEGAEPDGSELERTTESLLNDVDRAEKRGPVSKVAALFGVPIDAVLLDPSPPLT
jgi:hypothetical protein